MTRGGLQSSAYEVPVTLETPTISANAKILTDDIPITADFLNGNSGQLRIWFSFTAASDFEIAVTKLGEADLLGSPLKLNADQNFVIKSTGYYRFDIGVRPGDLINLSSTANITAINEFQVQKIPIAT